MIIGTREREALEALFNQEINLALAAQGPQLRLIHRLPKARAERMQAKGWIEPGTFRVGRDCLGAITVPYWRLTELGRYLYCQQCAEPEGETDA